MNLDLLKAHRDVFEDLTDQKTRREILNDLKKPNDFVLSLLRFDESFAFSWLLEQGTEQPYLILEMLSQFEVGQRCDLLWQAAISDSTLMPFDFRALCLELLSKELACVNFGLRREQIELAQTLIKEAPAPQIRNNLEKLKLPTDGIDHLFEMPETLEVKLKVLREVSRQASHAQRAKLLERFLKALNESEVGTPDPIGFRNLTVEQLIQEDVNCSFIRPTDYLVPWDQIFKVQDLSFTLAELTRLILFSDDLQVPSPRSRLAVLAFHRTCLKTSGRAIIGLKAGTFHVEHGTLATPAYFYMGRDSALGKGLLIDNVGGAVILSEAFLGGGFMPILIHTHKHLRSKGESAIRERQVVRPGIFLAESGKRLPMSSLGILETTDWLQTPSPWEGIGCYPIDKATAPNHRRVQL